MDSPASAVDLGSLDTLFSVVKKRQPTKGKRRREREGKGGEEGELTLYQEEQEEAEKKKKEAMRNAPKVVESARCQGIGTTRKPIHLIPF